MPKWMDDCVKAYKKKNPDDPESKAWAVCTTAYKKKFGKSPGEEVDDDILTESYAVDFLIEEVDEEETEFAYKISGAVIPKPKTEHGTYSTNHRLYPTECIKETLKRSEKYMKEDVSTMYTSHYAASIWSDKLPVGKVTELWMDDGALMFRGGMADTAEARDLRSLIEAGILERVSLRTRDWASRWEEVGNYGEIEVMEWLVLHGIDFAEVPGMKGTGVTREQFEAEDLEEEEQMDWKELTLAELQENRPDLVAEIVDGHTPEPTVEFQTPPEIALEIAIHKASNAGTGSIVFDYLMERVEEEEDLTDELLQEAREHAAKTLYGRHTPAPASNAKGDSSPAPGPDPHSEDQEQEEELDETQKEILDIVG